MIKENEIFRIGKLIKPHGVKGEIAFAFEDDIFDRTECPYLILCIDGIFVPFFIEEYRFKGSETVLITFEDMHSEEDVKPLSGLEVFFPRLYCDEQYDNEKDVVHSWSSFIGYKAYDNEENYLGVIKSIDTSTINILFVINNSEIEKEYLIPAVDEFVADIDTKNKKLYLSLIEGLLD